MSNKEAFERPNYGVIDPNNQGNINYKLYRSLEIVTIILLLAYSIYVTLSIIEIIRTSLNIFLELIVFIVELLIGFYSILLFYHLARGFAPITTPLTKKFTIENIENEETLPFITIMLPMYKEPFKIVKQTLLAAQDQNYPRNKFEIMVVDDSGKNEELENYCNEEDIKYITRKDRSGFKAGGINNALQFVKGEFILFIDADHIIERNIVKNCLLVQRENTIAVQTRIDFVNIPTYLTTISAFLQLQFFSLFQRARRATGSAIFAGGATLFNTKILKSFGGFDPLTIADDTDNSFIFRSKGYRIEYIDIIGAWAMVPWDPLHLLRQIWRWLTGITRSFRARVFTILRGNSPLYVKLDHFAVGFFPTLSIFGWGVAFVFIYIIQQGIILTRTPLLSYPIFGMTIALISSLSILTGTIAVFLDDKKILFHQKGLIYKIVVTGGFYLLILAAQPLLLGAIFKAWTGMRVTFNRTPKEKNTSDDLSKVMRQYIYYTSIIFLTGIIFLVFGFKIPLGDPRGVTLFISAYAAIIPLIIAFLWYWKLEGYLEEVADITAIEVLKEHAKS